MIRRMLSPNADLRCTAAEAMKDSYWQQTKDAEASSHSTRHKLDFRTVADFDSGRSSSYASSIVFEKDMAKLMDMSPWKRATKGKENLDESPGLGLGRLPKDQDLYGARHTITRIKSQPKVNLSKGIIYSPNSLGLRSYTSICSSTTTDQTRPCSVCFRSPAHHGVPTDVTLCVYSQHDFAERYQ